MTSPEENYFSVDRREQVLQSSAASRINANKTLLTEVRPSQGDETLVTEIHCSLSTEDCLSTSSKTERSEVNVEIQGLKETALSCSEIVVTSRVKTVYDRSLSGSTSSTELDDREKSLTEPLHEAEDAVFGEGACIDGEERHRKTSDSYYISHTYQVEAVERSSRSVTAVRSVSFRSSKDVQLAHRHQASQDSGLHFVDRFEEIIAGQEPDVVGSSKEKHVRFLWCDSDQEDAETLRRMQSAREDIQHLIETSNMVSDIASVVGDDRATPEPTQLTTSTSSNARLSEGSLIRQSQREASEQPTEEANRKRDLPTGSASESGQGSQVMTSFAANDTSEVLYGQTVSASDLALIVGAQPVSSSQITWRHSTTSPPADVPQRFDNSPVAKTSTSSTEPMGSLAPAGRRSPPILTYSPGMAIRSYALEELVEKKHLVTSDKKEGETSKPLRPDLSTSVGSGVAVTSSSSGHRFASPNDSNLALEVSKGDNDNSLDKLVDLESLQVGYRFHDVGVMQETGGICNLAFDDSDEHDSVLVSGSGLPFLGSLPNIDVSLTEAIPVQSSEVLSRSSLPTQSSIETAHSHGPNSALEHFSSLLTSTIPRALVPNLDHETTRLISAVQESPTDIKSPFMSEERTHTTNIDQNTIQSENTSCSKRVEHTRITLESVTQTTGRGNMTSTLLVEQAAEVHDVDDGLIVQEPDTIEAGESVIQKLAQSLEQEPLEVVHGRVGQGEAAMEHGNWLQDPGVKERVRDTDSKSTAKKAENKSTDREAEKAHTKKAKNKSKKKENKNRTQTKEYVNVSSTSGKSTSATPEVDRTFFSTDKNSARNLLKTEEARLVSQDETLSTPRPGQNVLIHLTETSETDNSRVDFKVTEGRKLALSVSDATHVKTNIVLEKGDVAESRNKEDIMKDKNTRAGSTVSLTRKFNVGPKFEATLRAQGALLKSESLAIAVYYDNQSYELTLTDCWLRSVNSKWQLHSHFTKLLDSTTQDEYTESEDKSTIIASLAAILHIPVPEVYDVSVAEFMQRAGLQEFARYTSLRKTYHLRGMVIDLELPEYGFWVGTVTATASSQARLHDAVRDVDSFWNTTGVQALSLMKD